MNAAYETALLDWLACAARGTQEPAARAAAELGDQVVHAGTAGHVLDFDDTYLPGIAHLTAPTAPAALVVGAELDRSVGEVLAAYAKGFEAMGALARASHPALYDNGWHPTAVCGGVGAAVAAAELLDAPREPAVALALLQASGLRAAFGSQGKSLQVGLAAGAGVQAARLAQAGARVPLEAAARGFEHATGGTYAEPSAGEQPAIERELDQGLALLPSDPRRDRGRRRAVRRRRAGRAQRDRPPGLPPGRLGGPRAEPTACRPSSRFPT